MNMKRLAGFLKSPQFLVPLILSLTALWWTGPLTELIYGQDFVSYFLNPFNFNFNPLAQYNLLYGRTTPLYDMAPNFYLDGASWFIQFLGASPAVTERILIVAGAFIGAFGFWNLLSVIQRINGPAWNGQLLPKLVATSFFVWNPFSLTITWWHFQEWSIFLMLAPGLLSALLDTLYSPKLPIRKLALFSITAVILAPGAFSPFAVAIVFGVGFFVVIALAGIFSGRLVPSQGLVKIGAMALLLVAVIGWTMIPYVYVASNLGVSQFTNLTNPSSLFDFESHTTSIANVARLTAFTWVHDHPEAYPWSWYFPVVALVSWGFAFMFALGCFVSKHVRGLGILCVLGLLSIFASIGANPPGTSINGYLLSLGGPFLILVNAYYFVGQYYVIVLGVAIFCVLSSSSLAHLGSLLESIFRKALARAVRVSRRTFRLTPEPQAWERTAAPSSRLRKSVPTLVVGCLLLTAAIPFAVTPLYSESGPFMDEFSLPESFPQLYSFLQQNYSGPIFNVLVLPMSSTGTYTLQVGNGSFPDTSSLLGHYIPYPLYYVNNGPVASAIENITYSTYPGNLSLVFQSLHIRYAIINPYFDSGANTMTTAPDGSVWNESQVNQSLTNSLGRALEVGSFKVFVDSRTTPVVGAANDILGGISPSLTTFYSFISEVRMAPPSIMPDLVSALWTATPVSGLPSLTPTQVSGYNASFNIGQNQTGAILTDSGILIPVNGSAGSLPSGVSYDRSSSTLLIAPTVLLSTNNSTLETNLKRSSSGFSNPLGNTSFLRFSRNVTWLNASISTAFSLDEFSGQNWLTWSIVQGQFTFEVTYYAAPSTDNFVIQETAYNESEPYAWNNVNVPTQDTLNLSNVLITIDSSTIESRWTGSETTSPVVDYLNYSGPDILRNGGHNQTIFPHGFVTLKDYSIQLIVNKPKAIVTSAEVLLRAPVSFLLLMPNSGEYGPLPARVWGDQSGELHLSLIAGSAQPSAYLVLDYPETSYWQVTTSAGGFSRFAAPALYTVFVLDWSPIGQNATLSVEVSLYNPTITGLYVSFVELPVLVAIFALTFGSVRKRLSPRRWPRWKRGAS